MGLIALSSASIRAFVSTISDFEFEFGGGRLEHGPRRMECEKRK